MLIENGENNLSPINDCDRRECAYEQALLLIRAVWMHLATVFKRELFPIQLVYVNVALLMIVRPCKKWNLMLLESHHTCFGWILVKSLPAKNYELTGGYEKKVRWILFRMSILVLSNVYLYVVYHLSLSILNVLRFLPKPRCNQLCWDTSLTGSTETHRLSPLLYSQGYKLTKRFL